MNPNAISPDSNFVDTNAQVHRTYYSVLETPRESSDGDDGIDLNISIPETDNQSQTGGDDDVSVSLSVSVMA